MSTATLTEILLDPTLATKGEQEARRLASEAAAEAKKVIDALNVRVQQEADKVRAAEADVRGR